MEWHNFGTRYHGLLLFYSFWVRTKLTILTYNSLIKNACLFINAYITIAHHDVPKWSWWTSMNEWMLICILNDWFNGTFARQYHAEILSKKKKEIVKSTVSPLKVKRKPAMLSADWVITVVSVLLTVATQPLVGIYLDKWALCVMYPWQVLCETVPFAPF